jgi:hypothetical protein
LTSRSSTQLDRGVSRIEEGELHGNAPKEGKEVNA